MFQSLRFPSFRFPAFWVVSALLAIALVGAIHAVESAPPPEPPSVPDAPPVSVQTAVVQRRGIIQWLFAEGRVHAIRKEHLFFERSGRVQEVATRDGEPLADGTWVRGPEGDRPGELLARLDARELQLALQEAQARLSVIAARIEGLKAGERQAARDAERFESLVGSGAVTAADRERADLALRTARADLAVAAAEAATLQAEHERLLFELQRTELRAPFSGVIKRMNLRVGDHVAPWDGERSRADREEAAALVLIDASAFEVELHLAPSEGARVQSGAPARVALAPSSIAASLDGDADAPAETGVVSGVSPGVSATERSTRVHVQFPRTRGGLRDGDFASVWITEAAREDVLVVPHGALLEERGRSFVFVVKEGRAQRLAVVTGLQDLHGVEVLEGVAEGSIVVVAGSHRLTDGTAVQVLPAGGAQP